MRNDHRRELTPQELHRQRRKEQVQRRRLVAALCLLVLIVIIAVLVATCNSGNDTATTTTGSTGSTGTTSTTLGSVTYAADLDGVSAVPAVNTTAKGTFNMTYDEARGTIAYTLEVTGLNKPRSAAVYEGAEGDSGTAVYTLPVDATRSGSFTGQLANGTVDAASFTGSLEGGTLDDLIALIKSGKAYVSVGTAANPVDAIRGQISLSADETSTSDTSDASDTTDSTDTTETTGGASSSDTTG